MTYFGYFYLSTLIIFIYIYYIFIFFYMYYVYDVVNEYIIEKSL